MVLTFYFFVSLKLIFNVILVFKINIGLSIILILFLKSILGVSPTGARTRVTRPGLRIVPTGKRARRPLKNEPNEVKEEEEEPQEEEGEEAIPGSDIPETPRASSGVRGRPINRVNLSDEQRKPSGGRRRIRPFFGRSQTGTPRRRVGLCFF